MTSCSHVGSFRSGAGRLAAPIAMNRAQFEFAMAEGTDAGIRLIASAPQNSAARGAHGSEFGRLTDSIVHRRIHLADIRDRSVHCRRGSPSRRPKILAVLPSGFALTGSGFPLKVAARVRILLGVLTPGP